MSEMANNSSVSTVPRIEYLKDVQKQEAPFYKKLTESVRKASETSIEKEAIDILSEDLQISNEHFKPYLQQAVLDSNFMILSSFIANKRAQKLETSHYTFDLNTFASRFVNKKKRLNDGNVRRNINFEDIGQDYGYVMQSVPSLNFMFGAFEADDLIKRERNKRNTDNLLKKGKVVQPKVRTNSGSDEDSEHDSTSEEVDLLFKRLCKRYRKNKKNPLNYFDFVTDESSFSSTVENIFHSSFLSKGGYVDLTMNSRDSRHKIRPVKRKDDDENDDQFPSSSQSILTFTKKDWFNWIEEY